MKSIVNYLTLWYWYLWTCIALFVPIIFPQMSQVYEKYPWKCLDSKWFRTFDLDWWQKLLQTPQAYFLSESSLMTMYWSRSRGLRISPPKKGPWINMKRIINNWVLLKMFIENCILWLSVYATKPIITLLWNKIFFFSVLARLMRFIGRVWF